MLAISADQLTLLSSLNCSTIIQLLENNNIYLINAVDSKFIGIVKTGEFCYDLSLRIEPNFIVSKKVYIDYNSEMDNVVASLGLTNR